MKMCLSTEGVKFHINTKIQRKGIEVTSLSRVNKRRKADENSRNTRNNLKKEGDKENNNDRTWSFHYNSVRLSLTTKHSTLVFSNTHMLHSHCFHTPHSNRQEVFFRCFKVSEAEWQDFPIINWRNGLQNPQSSQWLEKIVMVRGNKAFLNTDQRHLDLFFSHFESSDRAETGKSVLFNRLLPRWCL